MARTLNKLTETGIRALKVPGRHSDGGGLYLSVSGAGAKSWVFMWTPKGGKRREMGMGAYPAVSLAKARALGASCRVDVAEGRDPIAERDQTPEPTFGEASDRFIETIRGEWRNEKHAEQWAHSMLVRCAKIRNKRPSQVTTEDVLAVMRQTVTVGTADQERDGPFWELMPETAGRVRNRIERVLNYCKVKGWRDGENPAAWKGHLENLLPKPAKLIRGHQRALPYEEMPAFMADLRTREGLSARAAEITILTWARSGEVLGMRWPEVDFARRLWTCPASRMKGGKAHTVPLSARALEILTELAETKPSEFVFPGVRQKGETNDRPLSNMAMLALLRRMGRTDITMHGMRSAARDWAGDKTAFPREVVEHALAHKVGNTVEQAYRRSSALEKRGKLMEAWEQFCCSVSGTNNVVPIHAGARTA